MPQLTPVKRKKFEQFLRMIGCTLKRTRGDHLIYTRPGLKRPIVITTDTEVPMMHIRSNLKTLNMSVDEFLALIKQM